MEVARLRPDQPVIEFPELLQDTLLPSSVDAESSWDPPTPEIPPRTALVAPMPLATKKHTALVAPAPVVARPTAVAPAPEPSGKELKPVRAWRRRCATA